MRIALMVIRNILIAPYLFIRLLYYAKHYSGDYMPGFLWSKKIAWHAIKGGNIVLEVKGEDNIPKEDGFIYYPNHQGLFDSLTFYASSPKPFAAVIKKEAANVILLKQVIQATGSLSIDREDIRQSMKVINQMAEEVVAGRNYLIFAEGTRGKNGNVPGEFKGGSFKAAQKAKCPIVPCALMNCYIPFDRQSIRKVTVKLIYLKPMYYEEYKDMKTVDIATEVRRRIVEAIEKEEAGDSVM